MTKSHPAATTSRQIPEDLRMHRYHHGYVVSVCDDRAAAERAAKALADADFQREEMILVSHDVDALDSPWPGEDTLEVSNPASVGRSTEATAWGVTGGATGALAGAAISYIARLPPEGEWLRMLIGGVVGALVGALGGALGYRLLRRRPLAWYDTACSGQQVVVGIGLLRADDRERASRAEAVLSGLGQATVSLPE